MSEGVTAKKSDLGVRTASAVVMVTVAGLSLWLGGAAWAIFVVLVALGVLWEWRQLVFGFSSGIVHKTLWMLGGLAYVTFASGVLLHLRYDFEGAGSVLFVVGGVICTDIGAYFVGRAVGGAKIAPTISPSKTWAGLVGGMIGAALALTLIALSWYNGLCEVFYTPSNMPVFDDNCGSYIRIYPTSDVLQWAIINGSQIAVVAQAGDFFESWMKRRADVKDSGKLIPGHGGVFDRTDGMIAVLFVYGLMFFGTILLGR
jgi:phosphatidate cytidylyltransferase